MNSCFKCNEELEDDEGIQLLQYLFCSPSCLSKSLTLEQIKQLYKIAKL